MGDTLQSGGSVPQALGVQALPGGLWDTGGCLTPSQTQRL